MRRLWCLRGQAGVALACWPEFLLLPAGFWCVLVVTWVGSSWTESRWEEKRILGVGVSPSDPLLLICSLLDTSCFVCTTAASHFSAAEGLLYWDTTSLLFTFFPCPRSNGKVQQSARQRASTFGYCFTCFGITNPVSFSCQKCLLDFCVTASEN